MNYPDTVKSRFTGHPFTTYSNLRQPFPSLIINKNPMFYESADSGAYLTLHVGILQLISLKFISLCIKYCTRIEKILCTQTVTRQILIEIINFVILKFI